MNDNTPPSRLPILMSAVVFPGVGQFMQRRQAAGWMYALCFAVVVALFLTVLFRELSMAISTLRRVLATATPVDPDEAIVHWGPLIKMGGVLVLIYAANLYDVWLAWHRSRSNQKPNIQHPTSDIEGGAR
jgi:hypothetical protein